MKNSLDGSIASLMEKYRMAAENGEQKHETLHLSANEQEYQSYANESQHSVAYGQMSANCVEHAFGTEIDRIERLEAYIERLTTDNAILKQELCQLQQDYRASYRTAARTAERSDSLATKQLITQLFSDYRRKMDDDVRQLQQLSRLAVHDRGLGIKYNDVLDLICKRLAAAENQITTFESLVYEHADELQSYIYQLCDIQAGNDRRTSKIEDTLAYFRRKCELRLAKQAVVSKRSCLAAYKATMRILSGELRSVDYKGQLLAADVCRLAKDLIALREETELFKEKIGAALYGCEHYTTTFANFKEQTSNKLIALDSSITGLQHQLCYGYNPRQHVQTAESKRTELCNSEVSRKAGQYAACPLEQQKMERPIENSDSSTSYEAIILKNDLRAIGKTDNGAEKRNIAGQAKAQQDFFPYCLDNGRKASYQLQAFDIGRINKMLESDALPAPRSNLRQVIYELQEVGNDTQTKQKAQVQPTVEDILTRIDKLERRTMQRYIAGMYD